MSSNYIWITHQFEGYHKWINAPESEAFLKALHRHMFHVKVTYNVSHGDRDKEFFKEKKKLELFINETLLRPETQYWSCEMWAMTLCKGLSAYSVSVSEDGENGAIYIEDSKQ